MGKVLVTTPNGKVGQEVVKQLLARGVPVRVGSHTVERGEEAFPGADVRAVDYEDPATFGPALEGVTALYLASPATSEPDPERALVDAAKAGGVRRVVKLSMFGAQAAGDSLPMRAVEKHLEASGLEWTFLRPTWLMQNFSTIHVPSIRAGTLLEPAGLSRRAYVDARDVAAVAVKALAEPGHAGQAYSLTGPELLDRNQVAKKIGAAIGRTVHYRSCSDAELHELMKPYLPESYIELWLALYADLREHREGRVTDEVRRLLDRPPLTFDQFARDFREAWA